MAYTEKVRVLPVLCAEEANKVCIRVCLFAMHNCKLTTCFEMKSAHAWGFWFGDGRCSLGTLPAPTVVFALKAKG